MDDGTRASTEPEMPRAGTLPGPGLVARRAWWVLVTAALGAGFGLVASATGPPVYTSTAFLTVTGGPGDAPGAAGAARALARLAVSDDVFDLVRAEAGEGGDVTADAAPDAALLSVSGSAATAEQAQALAAAVVEQVTASGGAIDPYDVSVVVPPASPEDPAVPGWIWLAGGTGAGIATGVLLASTVPRLRGRTD